MVYTPTLWQRLGGFVATASDLSDGLVAEFAKVGGAWIVVVTRGDDASGPWNAAHLEELTARCAPHGVRVGPWINGWGGNPEEDADAAYALWLRGNGPAMLDLEAKYQYPAGDSTLMPRMVARLRDRMGPRGEMAVSTNGMNSASIWNGRTLTPPRSFYDLRCRVAPQWYSAYYSKDGSTDPVDDMKWLKEEGPTDFNVRSPRPTRKPVRGLPLSYVHGTIESTGVEGSDLSNELGRLEAARRYGLTPGFSLYLLERTSSEDFAKLAAVRGRLYL